MKVVDQNHPSLSIITVVYNGILNIEQTILSVINQNHNDFEYIIVDGGSTDGTLDIIKKYEDRLSLWISEKDNGIFDAMNKGITLATGRYVGLLNSGDYYEPDVFGRVLEMIEGGAEYGVIYGSTNLIIDLGTEIYSLPIIPNSVVDDRLLISPVFCHQSSFVRRDLFHDFGLFEEVSIAGDWLHFVKLYQNNVQFKYFDQVVANYLEGGASTTAKGFRESFSYKRKFGTFRYRDYLTLMFFILKDTKFFKRYLSTPVWKFKLSRQKVNFKRLK